MRFNQNLATWEFGKEAKLCLFFMNSGINKANDCAFKQRAIDVFEGNQNLGKPLNGACNSIVREQGLVS